MSKACKALIALSAIFIIPFTALASFWGFDNARSKFNGVVFAHPLVSFSETDYSKAVEWILQEFETRTGRPLTPGVHRRAGLKIYANSGKGMSTPPNLVRAVLEALRKRGFSNEELFMVDARETYLRDAGFLPPLSAYEQGPYFDGVRVHSLDSELLWDDTWFYDNPLPVQFSSPLGRELLGDPLHMDDEESRKSYLVEPLMTGVDFWINLPAVTDHRAMEINGALANATLWSVSNRERFFLSPANAPIAMAEIAAIPELLSGWAITMISLEAYQYIAGPSFNSYYTHSEPLLLASSDPVILDTLIAQRMNRFRKEQEFPLLKFPPQSASFAEDLGVGSTDIENIQWIRPLN